MNGNICKEQKKSFLQGKMLLAPIKTSEERFFIVAAIQISNNEKFIAMIYQINCALLFLQIWDVENQLTILNEQFGTLIDRDIKISFSGDSEIIGINQRYRPERCALIKFRNVKSQQQTELQITDFDSLISSELTLNYTGNKCIIHQYDYFYVFNSIWDNKNYHYSYSTIKNIRGYNITIKFSNFYDDFYIYQKDQPKLEIWNCYKNNKVEQTHNYFDTQFIDDIKEMEENKQLLVNCKQNDWSSQNIYLVQIPKFKIIRKIRLSSDYNSQDYITLLPRTDLILQLKPNQRKRVDEFIILKQNLDTYQESDAKLIYILSEFKVLFVPILIEKNSLILVSKNILLQVIKYRIEMYSFQQLL